MLHFLIEFVLFYTFKGEKYILVSKNKEPFGTASYPRGYSAPITGVERGGTPFHHKGLPMVG